MTDEFYELRMAENQGRIAQWEEHGVDAIKADLEHSNGIRIVGRHTRLAWKWVKFKEAQNRQAQEADKLSDTVSLTPEVFGMSIDLKKLFKWGKSKLKRK